MRQKHYRLILLPLFLVLACVGAFAQANSEVTGIVTDQTGAVVGGAKITLIDPATGATKTTVSGGTGLYDVPGLNPANYNLKITAKGFESFAQNGIVVNVSSTAHVDVKLTIGAESQTVTVEADALAVQSDSNVVSSLIDSQQISEIATENRNFAALAALGLGVSSALPDSNTPTSVAASFTISVNGLRQSHNIWLIDGGEADDRGGAGGMDIMPSQDAIAEFNMMTSNYPPDYGISSGATMSLSLKSGTRKFHGEVWEFNRNTDYDAAEVFSQAKANVHYNIYGVNAGGPLFIPHVYNTNKDKTFFFWNEEWRKILTGAGASNNPTLDSADIPSAGSDLTYVNPKFATALPGAPSGTVMPQLVVPTVNDPAYLAKLAGLDLTPGECFSKQAPVMDSYGKPTCPGTAVIPHQLFDPNAVLYLNAGILPKANQSNDYNITNVSNPITVRDDVVRIDEKITDKWQLLGHYMHDSVLQGYAQPELGWDWASYNTITSTLSNPSNSAAIKLTGTLSPNLLVEASINYDGNVINIVNSPNSKLPSGWAVAPVSSSFAISRDSVPGITGFGTPYGTGEDTASAPWHNAAEDYEPKVDLSYTQGKHQMKFGFSYNRYTKNQQLFGDEQGDYSFGALSGDGIMDMLLGLPGSYSQFQAVPIRHYVNQTPSVYAMDNWHVTSRLSLQLGLRYDALPHAWERSNQVANFDPAAYIPSEAPVWNGGVISASSQGLATVNGVQYYLNGMGLASQNDFPRGLVTNDFKTLQPRVGFSEDLFGTGKTILRGGFGTFYERLQGNDIYFSNPGTSWVDGSNVTASGAPIFAASVTNLAKNYRAPAVAQFSLGVQHEISPSIIWVVQYVGNLAWHQNVERNINTYPLSTDPAIRQAYGDPNGNAVGDSKVSSLANANLYRTYQGYSGITQQENTTNGSYNGFQTGLRMQNRWGLSGELDYTYSHEIDLTSYDLDTVSNPWNLKYDKGSGALDRRNIFSANYVYKLPFFNKSNSLVHTIAGGWEVAGTIVDESGTIPANQGAGLSTNYDSIGLGGGYTNRPNVNGKVGYTKTRSQWFNINQFSNTTPAWLNGANQGFGSASKDAIVGPGRVNFTTSLYKSFAVTEGMHFELRFESFNTFNHTQYNGVSTSFGSGNFGQVTSAWDSRKLELGGKFVF